MMSTYRVTDDQVKEIIKTTLEDVTPFIKTANTLINDVLAEDIEDGNVSAAELIQIELWLSAHFVAIREPRAMSRSTGESSVKYHGQTGKGLESTPYGQQVMIIDSTGKLADRGKSQKRAGFKAIDFSTASS